MSLQNKQEKWFSTSTVSVKAETVIPLTGKCYAVYPDAVRMGLSGVNTCVAVFKYKEQAMRFGNSMWQDKWILKQIKL